SGLPAAASSFADGWSRTLEIPMAIYVHVLCAYQSPRNPGVSTLRIEVRFLGLLP
ncbi:MAG: hypothetical protein ACI9TB_001443, partial [Parasphingorhabdus sp.]